MTTTTIITEDAPPVALLVQQHIPGFAHVTDFSIDGGLHIAKAVTAYHCAICHRAGLGDGSGSCRHKDALYTFEAAARDEAEAERLREDRPEPYPPPY